MTDITALVRIAELERIAQKQDDALNVLRGSIAAYQVGKHEARIAELEALLKPFAEASDYVDGIYHLDDNAAIYIKVAYLRAARAKLNGEME